MKQLLSGSLLIVEGGSFTIQRQDGDCRLSMLLWGERGRRGQFSRMVKGMEWKTRCRVVAKPREKSAMWKSYGRDLEYGGCRLNTERSKQKSILSPLDLFCFEC